VNWTYVSAKLGPKIHESRLEILIELAGVLVFVTGEFLGIMDVLFGASVPGSDEEFRALATFFWGSVITVRSPSFRRESGGPNQSLDFISLGIYRISHLYCGLLDC
jgi:hypothetical protein